jgi:hypothetical protein
MNERAMIERHLAQAAGHVALGERPIARQIAILAELERDGHEATAQYARASGKRPIITADHWLWVATIALIENPAGAQSPSSFSCASCDLR